MKKIAAGFFEKNARVYLALVLPVFLLYAKSLKFDFTPLDEQWLIIRNADYLKSWRSVPDAFGSSIGEIYYRPLFIVSLIVDYHIGKLSPFIYHFINLAWHLAAVLLLYRFLVLFNVEKKVAYFGALVLGVHPVMVHAVVWIPGRNDLMLCVFAIAALINLVRYQDQSSYKNLVLHFLFFICALFTKESAIVLPFIFMVCILIRSGPNKQLIFFSVAWIAIAASWFLLRAHIVTLVPFEPVDFQVSFKNALAAFVIFTGKALLPFQQSVMPTLNHAILLPGILCIPFCIVLCLKPGRLSVGLKNNKPAFFGLFIFVVMLLIPVWFGATKAGGEHYEHRMYSSMAGLILFFSHLNVNPNGIWVRRIALLITLLFALKTFVRMDVYKNKTDFLEQGIKEYPDYYLFHLKKGDGFFERHLYTEAIASYNKALEIRPDYSTLYNSRGSAYYALGMDREAANDFTKAISLSDFDERLFLNRCRALYYANDIEKAMLDLVVLKKCCQPTVPAQLEKEIMDKWIVHMEDLKKQLRQNPSNASLYAKCAQLYFDIEMKKEGLIYLKKAMELEPANSSYAALHKKQEMMK